MPNGNGTTSLLREPLPLYVCSFPHLDLTVEDDRQRDREHDQALRVPKVLILEAWYLMSGSANDNHADETTPMVKWSMQRRSTRAARSSCHTTTTRARDQVGEGQLAQGRGCLGRGCSGGFTRAGGVSPAGGEGCG